MKVGDKVLVSHGSGFNHRYTIETIDRETKTQWVVAGLNYWKKDGAKVGERFRGGIEELTPEAQADFDEKSERDSHRRLWREIQMIEQPYHLKSARLAEILAELKA